MSEEVVAVVAVDVEMNIALNLLAQAACVIEIDPRAIDKNFWQEFGMRLSDRSFSEAWLTLFDGTLKKRKMKWQDNRSSFFYSLTLGRDLQVGNKFPCMYCDQSLHST